MVNAVIEVEFLGGTDIKDAIQEAMRLRIMLGVSIRFKFNEQKVLICRNDQNADDLVKQYEDVMAGKIKRLIIA